MKKSIYALIAIIAFVTIVKAEKVHAEIGRSPSVEAVTEVEIHDAKKIGSEENKGFDFNHHTIAVVPSKIKRVPANITKSQKPSASSYIGPMIFLLTLPFAIWVVISKKINAKVLPEKHVDYYPKTQQFKPYRTDYQQSSEDEDDQDFPRAS